jgi:hypothetical protein
MRIAGTIGKGAIIGLLLTCAMGPQLIHPRTRTCPLPGVPGRDYQWGSLSQPREARSTIGLLLEVSPGAPVVAGTVEKPRVRYFQLDVAQLAVDHCQISRVTFHTEDDGTWKLNLRADQNPQFRLVKDGGTLFPGTPDETLFPGPRTASGRLYTEHLLRNQFFVRVRCLGGLPVQQKQPNLAAAPVLLRMEPPGFWVQRAVPLEWGANGFNPELPIYFNRIDRIEVEFYYR